MTFKTFEGQFSVLIYSSDIHPVVVFVDELPVCLQNLMESSLHAVLAAAQRVAVIVQQSIHICTLHHLHQDGRQLALQSKQALQKSQGDVTDASQTSKWKKLQSCHLHDGWRKLPTLAKAAAVI